MKNKPKQGKSKKNTFILDVILTEDGFFIVDKNWCCTYISENSFKGIQKRSDSLIGKSIWDIFPTLKKTQVYKKALLAIRTRKKQEVEYKCDILHACFTIHMYPVKDGLAVFFHDITKQKEIEEELIESKYKYKSMVETSNDIIVMLDVHGKIVYVSPAIKKTLGYSPKELIGTQSLIDVLPEEKAMLHEAMRKALQGNSVTLQYSAKHKKGYWVKMEASSKVILDKNKKPYLIVTNSRDITKRLEYEKKLQESEEKFRSLIEHSASVYELLDREGNILYLSESFSKVFKLSTKAYIGINVFDLIHPDDLEMIRAIFNKVLLHPGRAETFVHRANHPTRQWVWLETTCTNYLDNPAIRAIVVNFRDITKRKLAEEKLLENEERLQALADNIPNLVWISDAGGKIFWYNSRWYEYTGKNPKQMEGNGWESVFAEKELPGILEKWRLAKKSGIGFEMIFPLKGKDGIFRPFLTRVVPLKDKNGKILQWFGTNTDITEQKQIEQRKDDFVALASHELKTPLTSTKILTQVLKKRFANNQDALLLLTKMDNQIDKLSTLVTEMLDISRIEKGKLELKSEKFYIETVAKEVVDDLQQVTNHTLIMDWQTHEYFFVDKERVRQVIVNFITNAIKYSPEEKEIIIRSRKIGDTVVVSVQDFGVGIPKNEQKHIFDRFYQAKANQGSTYPGLGLGLYISKELITRMEGNVWVESTVGKGSTFFFSLPILKQ